MKKDSLTIILDSVERLTNKRPRPSELARELNVSEQMITNWRKRGVSVDGALAAQKRYLIDANYLLGRVDAPMAGLHGLPEKRVLSVSEPRSNVYQSQSHQPVIEIELLGYFRTLDQEKQLEAVNFIKVFSASKMLRPDGQNLRMAG